MAQRKLAAASRSAKRKSVAANKKSKTNTKVTSKSKSKSSAKLIELNLVNQSSEALPSKFLTKWVNAVALLLQSVKFKDERLQNLQWSGAELTIAFLEPDHARELNRSYRGKDYATDVLSFGDSAPGVLGELAICPAVVAKQASEHGLSYEMELGYMVLHGMLHLLGFDHEKSAAEEKLMFAIQDAAFDALRERF